VSSYWLVVVGLLICSFPPCIGCLHVTGLATAAAQTVVVWCGAVPGGAISVGMWLAATAPPSQPLRGITVSVGAVV
jgi:hypothetical protein